MIKPETIIPSPQLSRQGYKVVAVIREYGRKLVELKDSLTVA
jgi:hypothetical protein